MQPGYGTIRKKEGKGRNERGQIDTGTHYPGTRVERARSRLIIGNARLFDVHTTRISNDGGSEGDGELE